MEEQSRDVTGHLVHLITGTDETEVFVTFGKVLFVDDQLLALLEWELVFVVLHTFVLVLRNLEFLRVLEALLKLF